MTSPRFAKLDSADDVADEPIGDDLLTSLAQAHDSNPAQRRCDNFLNHLEYSAPCNLTELKFMICSSRESPTITRRASLKMQVHILKYIGK